MLAGSLQQRGLPLGVVNESAAYNKKGNRESSVLQQIHDRVLTASGGSWQSVPPKIVWPDAALVRLRTFITEMNAKHEHWGFKDPRALLLLDGWRQLVSGEIALVGIYRHPSAVARSLAARSPMPRNDGFDLWCAYNERLVTEHRRAPFPILRFDAKRERLLAQINAVASAWGLRSAPEEETFFDESLRHHDDERTANVPRSCRRLWNYLEKHQLMT
jgi:hypothetical protein